VLGESTHDITTHEHKSNSTDPAKTNITQVALIAVCCCILTSAPCKVQGSDCRTQLILRSPNFYFRRRHALQHLNCGGSSQRRRHRNVRSRFIQGTFEAVTSLGVSANGDIRDTTFCIKRSNRITASANDQADSRQCGGFENNDSSFVILV